MVEVDSVFLTALVMTICVVTSMSQTCGRQKSADILNLGAQFLTTTTARPTSTTSRRTTRRTPRRTTRTSRRTSTCTTSRRTTTCFTRQTPRPHNFSRRVLEHETSKLFRGNPPRIVGGFEISDPSGGQLCWQVLIQARFPSEDSLCGGTIVGKSTVISAAHCFVNERTGEDAVIVGIPVGAIGTRTTGAFGEAEFAADCGQSVEALFYTIHPDYDPSNFNNDLAVIVLRNPLDLTRPCICAACLESKEPAVGETCVVSGFGETQEAQRPIEPLKWLPVQVLENRRELCSFNPGTNPDLFVCAGVVPNEDSCSGDSGGPLVCFDNIRTNSYYLAGTVSFGSNPCATGEGAQYTKTRAFFYWIMANSAGTLRAI